MTTQKLALVFRIANALLLGSLAILVVWLGANLVLDKHMTIGMLLAFIAYKDQFLGRVEQPDRPRRRADDAAAAR